MKFIHTEALLLRSFPLSESDRIIACLTRDYGLVRVVAYGARRLRSRFGGSTEPFTVADIEYRQKEDAELGVLERVDLIISYFYLSDNLAIVSAFSYFAELLSEFAPPHEPNEKLYRMAKACFAAVAETADDADKIKICVLYFELWLLRLAGFLPELRQCSECRTEFGKTVPIIWAENRFLCSSCGEKKGMTLTILQAGILRAAQRFAPAKFVAAVKAESAAEALELNRLTRRLIRQILLRDLSFWNAENRMGESPAN